MGSGSCASALAAESPSLDPPTAGSTMTMATVVVAVLVAVMVVLVAAAVVTLRVDVVKRAAMRRRQAGGNYHVFAERCFAFSPTVLDS